MPFLRRGATLPNHKEIDRVIDAALAEDLGAGDVTSALSIPRGLRVEGRIIAKEKGVLAGAPIAARTFLRLDRSARASLPRREGSALRPGDCVLVVRGSARALLAAERTALNFLQHLSGVATQTSRIVEATRKTGVRVLATRKTIPGLRSLQKYAVQAGGGSPHRQGLFDAILLKENHLELAGRDPLDLLVAMRARAGRKTPIGAEARNRNEAMLLLEGGADWILLDNMKPNDLRKTVRALRERARELRRSIELEASGGIHEGNAKAYAATGVDRLSLGALTHSVRAMDFSMDFTPSLPRGKR